MRPVACKLVEELNFYHYTMAYDENNNKVKPPSHVVKDLVPPRHKHIFARDLDSSIIINDDTTFEALTSIDWTSADIQMVEEEELAQDDPESSRRHEED